MTTLKQLLENLLDAPSQQALKAAQEAIVAHVEGAMGDALVFGAYMSAETERKTWEKLVKGWTE